MMTDETDTFLDASALARVHGRAAIAVLVEFMNKADAPAGVRVSAARTLLDWGWGKVGVQRAQEPRRPAPMKQAKKVPVDAPSQNLNSATVPPVDDAAIVPLAHACESRSRAFASLRPRGVVRTPSLRTSRRSSGPACPPRCRATDRSSPFFAARSRSRIPASRLSPVQSRLDAVAMDRSLPSQTHRTCPSVAFARAGPPSGVPPQNINRAIFARDGASRLERGARSARHRPRRVATHFGYPPTTPC